jgi:hypothetical protein
LALIPAQRDGGPLLSVGLAHSSEVALNQPAILRQDSDDGSDALSPKPLFLQTIQQIQAVKPIIRVAFCSGESLMPGRM